MKNSPDRNSAATSAVPTQSLRGKLMFAASAGILALVAPGGFYGMRAEAQLLPDECVDIDPNNPPPVNFANDGETFDCVADLASVPIQNFSTTANNLTLQIGAENGVVDSTVVGGSGGTGSVISMTGDGAQTLDIRASGKITNDEPDTINSTVSINTDGSLSITNIRYDTTQSDQFSEHKGWAGITFKF